MITLEKGKKIKVTILGLVLILLFTLFVYNKRQMKKSEMVVNYCVNNAITFDFDNTAGSIPEEFIQVLSPYKVVISGERHYVKEHQEMMGSLIEALHDHGFRYYVQETSTATGLMIDYYIKGKLHNLTQHEKNVDIIMIQKLFEFNKGLREKGQEDEQISYVGCDLNHMGVEYKTALIHMVNLYQLPVGIFNSYENDPLRIKNALEKEEIKQLTDSQIEEIKYITEAEIESLKTSKNGDENERENFMEKYVMRIIDASKDEEKVLVNVGAWHAQLTLHWNHTRDKNFQWLGMRLKERYKDSPNGLYSFFCNGYKGEIRENLYSPHSFMYEADNEISKRSLIPALMKKHKNQVIFSDFRTVPDNDVPIKIQTPHRIEYLPVNTQFNGMLVYPEISVPSSLKFYENW